MKSLEVLENIIITFDEGGYEPTTLGAKSGHFKEVFGDEINIIKHDLECFEECKNENCNYQIENAELQQENENLKQAIEILKLVCSVNCDKTLETERQFFRLTKEEYELLKEVLGNEN